MYEKHSTVTYEYILNIATIHHIEYIIYHMSIYNTLYMKYNTSYTIFNIKYRIYRIFDIWLSKYIEYFTWLSKLR